MTALLEERERPYKTAEGTDTIKTDAGKVVMDSTAELMDATMGETDETTEKMTTEEMDVLIIPLVTSNELQDPPLSAQR